MIEKCIYDIQNRFTNISELVKYDDNNNMDEFKAINRDLNEYLKNICCVGNIYIPRCDFYIHLPKVFNKININLKEEKSKCSEILNINYNNNLNSNQNENESIYKKATKRVINDLYRDLS